MSIYKQYDLPLEGADDADTGPPSQERSKRRTREVREQGILEQAFAILSRRHQRGELLSSPDATRDFLRLRLASEPNEVFGCIFLDNRHRIIAVEDLFHGTIDGASVYPRVIVQRALAHNAAALVAFHNHPSGVAEPSQSDIRITARIKEALALIEVRLLDHLVVSVETSTSFAERGLL